MKKSSKTTPIEDEPTSERVSFRFRPDVMRKLWELEKKKGLNRNGVAALAIMELAEREGV